MGRPQRAMAQNTTQEVGEVLELEHPPMEEKPRGNNQILGTHLGHQEVERVVQGLDSIFEYLPPEQWMSDFAVSQLLCSDLGYEDIDEFEDALRGKFEDFLSAMPHIETREPLETEEGGLRFRMKALPPMDERIPTKLVYRINSSDDLWRVALKSSTARMFFPELEFEIAPDGLRHVDAVYNHIASAIWNLGQHTREDLKDVNDDDKKYKIMATAAALNVMLDVEEPFTVILEDPDGLSTFKPEGLDDGSVVRVENFALDDPVGMEGLGKFLVEEMLHVPTEEEEARLDAEAEERAREILAQAQAKAEAEGTWKPEQ